MAIITKSEFDTARKSINEAILRHGDLVTALQIMPKFEADALRISMKKIADYFQQTHYNTVEKSKEKTM